MGYTLFFKKFPVLESDPLTFFFLLTHNKFTPNFSQLFTSQKNILVRMSKFHFIFFNLLPQFEKSYQACQR